MTFSIDLRVNFIRIILSGSREFAHIFLKKVFNNNGPLAKINNERNSKGNAFEIWKYFFFSFRSNTDNNRFLGNKHWSRLLIFSNRENYRALLVDKRKLSTWWFSCVDVQIHFLTLWKIHPCLEIMVRHLM